MYRKSITSRDVYTLGYLQPSINIPNIVFVDSRLINLGINVGILLCTNLKDLEKELAK